MSLRRIEILNVWICKVLILGLLWHYIRILLRRIGRCIRQITFTLFLKARRRSISIMLGLCGVKWIQLSCTDIEWVMFCVPHVWFLLVWVSHLELLILIMIDYIWWNLGHLLVLIWSWSLFPCTCLAWLWLVLSKSWMSSWEKFALMGITLFFCFLALRRFILLIIG